MLSERQQQYKKNRIKGMNQYRAAVAAGYSHAYASRNSKVLENSVDMAAAFRRKGIDDDSLVEIALEGLEATKRYGKDGDVEDKDWAVVHRFFESICKLTGRLDEKPLIDLSKHKHLTVIVKRNEEIPTDGEHTTDSGSNGRVRLNA